MAVLSLLYIIGFAQYGCSMYTSSQKVYTFRVPKYSTKRLILVCSKTSGKLSFMYRIVSRWHCRENLDCHLKKCYWTVALTSHDGYNYFTGLYTHFCCLGGTLQSKYLECIKHDLVFDVKRDNRRMNLHLLVTSIKEKLYKHDKV